MSSLEIVTLVGLNTFIAFYVIFICNEDRNRRMILTILKLQKTYLKGQG